MPCIYYKSVYSFPYHVWFSCEITLPCHEISSLSPHDLQRI
uniref:Uncharacterized protein n=1 Tax=Anguilla anguilla TaxID=7936 RepID=A0A0E9SWB8_ANGAN